MGEWMEIKAQLGIGVKLIISFPLGVCWEGWDAWWIFQYFGDRKPIVFSMALLGLTLMMPILTRWLLEIMHFQPFQVHQMKVNQKVK